MSKSKTVTWLSPALYKPVHFIKIARNFYVVYQNFTDRKIIAITRTLLDWVTNIYLVIASLHAYVQTVHNLAAALCMKLYSQLFQRGNLSKTIFDNDKSPNSQGCRTTMKAHIRLFM